MKKILSKTPKALIIKEKTEINWMTLKLRTSINQKETISLKKANQKAEKVGNILK